MNNHGLKNHSITSLIASLPVDVIDKYHPVPFEFGSGADLNTNSYYFGAIRAMMLDDEIESDIEMRHATAMGIPFLLTGSDKDIQFVKNILDDFDLESLMEQMLKAIEFGFMPVEIKWQRDNVTQLFKPVDSEPKRPELFRINKEGELFYTANGAYQIQRVPTAKVIGVLRQASSERPYGQSILESLWAIWQSKWISWANIERLGEKYAIPTVVSITKDANDQTALDSIANSLAPIMNGDSVAIGGDTTLHVLDAKGKVNELLLVVEHIDRKISKKITGQSLSGGTQAQGSRALGEVYERASMRLSKSDAKMVFKALNNTLLKWIFEVNNISGQVKVIVDSVKYDALVSNDSAGNNAPSNTPRIELADIKGMEHLCLI